MFNLSYAHFATAYRRQASQDKAALFASLGWPESLGAGFANGAVVTSLALLSAGATLGGNRRIESGPWAGKRVFTGADALADWLDGHFSAPEDVTGAGGLGDIAYGLFGRRGIVAFRQGIGPQGGLIGLLDGRNASALCCRAESHHPQAVQFWELN